MFSIMNKTYWQITHDKSSSNISNATPSSLSESEERQSAYSGDAEDVPSSFTLLLLLTESSTYQYRYIILISQWLWEMGLLIGRWNQENFTKA